MRRGPGHDRKLPRPGLLPSKLGDLAIIAALIGIIALIAVLFPHGYVWMGLTGGWVAFLAGAVVIGWRKRQRSQVEELVVKLRFRACTECGYSLHDAAQVGKCPECGARYELDRTIRAWQTWLDR